MITLVLGLSKDAEFTDLQGRRGKIIELRHKIVARFHYALAHFEARFPHLRSFQTVSFSPGGDELIEHIKVQLKERHEGLRQSIDFYSHNDCPLGVLAEGLGVDTIETAIALVTAGGQLKVALGSLLERSEAHKAISDNERKGCVLDLLALWTAWKLKALPAIEAIAGVVHLCRSTIDRLQ